MSKRVIKYPRNVLFAVGQEVTFFQARAFCGALSYFQGFKSKREIEDMSLESRQKYCEDIARKLYEVPISELYGDFAFTERFHQKLKKDIIHLRQIGFETENEAYFESANIFTLCRYERKNGLVLLKLTDAFVEQLLLMVLNGYKPFHLVTILSLKSCYSIRLYMFFISQMKYSNMLTISHYLVDTLKTNLGIIDEEGVYIKESYKRWANFKDKVLYTAIEEINEITDLHVICKPKRVGRYIKALDFEIKRVPKVLTPVIEKTTNPIIEYLVTFGMNRTKAKELAPKYPDLDFIKYAADLCTGKDNPAGYLLASISDLHSRYRDKIKAESTEKELAAAQKELEELRALKREKEQLEVLKHEQELEQLSKIYDALPMGTKKAVEKEAKKRNNGFATQHLCNLVYQEFVAVGKIIDGKMV